MSTSRGLPSVLRNLWAFHIAAEEQQFQLAAARLNIAQSAVSRRIRQLEDDLGVKLFERRASGVQLTPEGDIFRTDVVRILNGIDESVARVRRASKGKVGTLRVGFVEMAMRQTLLTRAVMQFRVRFPEVELKLMPMLSADVERAVRSEAIDVGFFNRNGAPLDGVEYRRIASHQLLLAVPANGPHAQDKPVRLASLQGESFIMPSRVPAPEIHDRLLLAFRLAGVEPTVLMEAGTSETMMHMVAAGLGLGFVDSSRRDSKPAGVLLRSIIDFSDALELEMAWQSGNASHVVGQFVAVVESLIPLRGARARKRGAGR